MPSLVFADRMVGASATRVATIASQGHHYACVRASARAAQFRLSNPRVILQQRQVDQLVEDSVVASRVNNPDNKLLDEPTEPLLAEHGLQRAGAPFFTGVPFFNGASSTVWPQGPQ